MDHTAKNYDPTSVEIDTNSQTFSKKWRSVKEYKTASNVRKRFEEMKNHRRTSCPFPSSKNVVSMEEFENLISGRTTGAYSWEDRWTDDLNLATMKRYYIQGWPNMKSSMSFSFIENAQARFQKQNIQQIFKAQEEDDEPKVDALKEIYRYWSNISDVKKTKNGTFHDILISGNAFSYVTRQRVVRNIEKIISDKKNAEKYIKEIRDSDNEVAKARLEKRLKSGKPLTRKEQVVEYDNVARIHRSYWEIYVDPDARCLHGNSYAANDLIDRTTPSLSEFKNEFEGSSDPFVIKENVKKVKSAQEQYNDYDNGVPPLFSVANDIGEGSKRVEVLRYWNKRRDKYIVVVNDIVVRDGPNPFAHKQIPYAHHKFFVIEHMFYGVGYPYVLECLQSEDEATRNLFIQQLKYNLMPPMLRNINMFSEEDSFDYLEPGKIYDLSGDISEHSIRWMNGSSYRPDFFQHRNLLKEEAILTTGVNTMASSMPQPGSAVRNNLMAQEAGDIILNKGIENWAWGDKDATRFELATMIQIGPEIYTKEVDKKTGEKKFKSIRMEGQKLIPEYENVDSEKEKKLIALRVEESDKATYFEVNEEYFDLSADIEIELDFSSIPLASEALLLSKIEKYFETMLTFWKNPELLDAPGANDAVVAYTRLLSPMNKEKIIESLRGESDKKSIERAYEQNNQMLDGMTVTGKPGESLAHQMAHFAVSFELSTKLSDPDISEDQRQKLIETLGRIHTHVQLDSTPKWQASKANDAVNNAAQQMNNQSMNAGMPPVQDPNQMPVDPMMVGGGDPMMAQAMQGGGMPMGNQMPMPQQF